MAWLTALSILLGFSATMVVLKLGSFVRRCVCRE